MQQEYYIQAMLLLIAPMLVLTILWLLVLHRYFQFLKKTDHDLFTKLGSPDLRRGKFAREVELLKHLFSSINTTLAELERKQRQMRLFFLLYVVLFVIVFLAIFFPAFEGLSQ